jgi:HEAT repeat protein
VLSYDAMDEFKNEAQDLKKMIADHMEGGYLDNIIDMFKHDESLYECVGYLMTDERMRVRIGATALIETLRKESENVRKAVPYILPLLKDENPVTRGDAAYLLGIIGEKDTIPYLEEVLDDKDSNVSLIVKEAIDDINSNPGFE